MTFSLHLRLDHRVLPFVLAWSARPNEVYGRVLIVFVNSLSSGSRDAGSQQFIDVLEFNQAFDRACRKS